MPRYQCQDADCRHVIPDRTFALRMPVVLRATKAGTYVKDGKPWPDRDHHEVAYTLFKCPMCRGTLEPLPDTVVVPANRQATLAAKGPC